MEKYTYRSVIGRELQGFIDYKRALGYKYLILRSLRLRLIPYK